MKYLITFYVTYDLAESFLQANAILTMSCSDQPLSSHNEAHAILSSATFDSLI